MKTKVLTLVMVALMGLASVSALAGSPPCTMPFYTANGIIRIPVKVEETCDSLPCCVKDLICKRQQQMHCLVTLQFDLSQITKTEADADDVTIDTQAIFQALRYNEYARK
ncbi:MAG: hypothetical protein V2I46_13050 [Bacteroides sp.]|jgi:hypothetical protein|nr:hypothetical protein [Bacteroides sp.]